MPSSHYYTCCIAVLHCLIGTRLVYIDTIQTRNYTICVIFVEFDNDKIFDKALNQQLDSVLLFDFQSDNLCFKLD